MRVFISYGHDEHISFARNLTAALQEKGYEVWFDEKRLTGGVLWEEYIEKGLKWVAENSTGKMILIMTPHSVRRPDGFCLNELAYALDLRLAVLPIMLVWTTPPLSIYRYQWLDLTDRQETTPFAEDFRKIIAALENCEKPVDSSSFQYFRNNLEPLDFSQDIKLYQPGFVGRTWIMTDFNQWLADPCAQRIYFLTGLPGVGKTAMAVKLLQTCGNIMAFHLCRRGNNEKTSLKRAICSIAYQLAQQLPAFKELLCRVNIVAEKDRCNEDALFDVLVANPLNACVQHADPTVILFDALDEAGDDYRSPFASFLARNLSKLPVWVRLVITSRPVETVLCPLQQFKPHVLTADSSENLVDIREYVDRRLSELYGDSAPDGEAIIKRSEGIFLYAKYVCDELPPDRPTDAGALQLPSGMGAIYYDFFTRHCPDIHFYRDRIRPFLEIICAQVEPFDLSRLSACSGKSPDLADDFIAMFKSFVYLGNDGKIRPFHSSFTDWLGNRRQAGIYAVSKESGTDSIAQYLIGIFKKSGWNFFMTGEDADYLINWFPAILERIETPLFDAEVLLKVYFERVKNKFILNDLVPDRKRFHFIKSVFRHTFKHTEKGEELFNGYPAVDLHVIGLKFLYSAARSETGSLTLRERKELEPEYYYFLDVKLPALYVSSSFDGDIIFKSLAYGYATACDDGRLSSMNGILSDIYKLATTDFKDYADTAASYLEEIALHRNYGFEDALACAEAIRKSAASDRSSSSPHRRTLR